MSEQPPVGSRKTAYKRGSLSLVDAVSMGTGVMIGAGILALTGQLAELAGPLFVQAFLGAALVAGFSAYSYVKMASAYPSAGGIGMFFAKAYGPGLVTASCALLMAFSMVINESLVARTFASYALRPFAVGDNSEWLVPTLAVGAVIFAFLVNLSGNDVIGRFSLVTAVVKVGGILLFAIAALWASGRLGQLSAPVGDAAEWGGATGFLAAVALGVLAYKGFTTITNSGDEVIEPHKNIGRAIVISLIICVVVYLLVALAVAANLTVPEIVVAKDYALAEAARPALGDQGMWFTVAIAVAATITGLVASTFAVSRMLAMVTEMKLVPHSHFGMSGTIQKHTLVYVVVLAGALAAFFDLSRIASLGVILYLLMDMAMHWGVWRHLRIQVGASSWVLVSALALDATVLGAFVVTKLQRDPMILVVAGSFLLAIVLGEWAFLRRAPSPSGGHHH